MAVAAAIPAAIGLVEFGVGELEKAHANKAARAQARNRPKEQPSPYAKDALSLAESELATGISGRTKQLLQETEDRDYGTAMGDILKGGGSVNNISTLFGNKKAGQTRLLLMGEQLRQNQMTNLQRAQAMSEEDRQQEFNFNKWAPWADEAQAIAAQKQSAANDVNQGINTLGTAAEKYAEGQQLDKEMKKYFGSPTTASVAQSVSYTPVNRLPVSEPGAGEAPQINNNYPDLNYKFDFNTFSGEDTSQP